MTTPKEVAEFMMREMETSHYLYQETVVHRIKQIFGAEFVYPNANGNDAISPKVLKEFRKLSGDQVIWERGSRAWRKRKPSDKPTRQQE